MHISVRVFALSLVLALSACASMEDRKERETIIITEFPGSSSPEPILESQEPIIVEMKKPNSPLDIVDNGNTYLPKLDLKLLLMDYYAPAPYRKQELGYGYYVYLIFADNSENTYMQRVAAATAFMCNFTHVSRSDVQDFLKHETALFQAPVRSESVKEDLVFRNQPLDLILHYSYAEGQLFQRKVQHINNIDSIGIIGSPRLINPRANNVLSLDIQVLDISHFSPIEIRETILALRKVVTKNYTAQHQNMNLLPNFNELQSPKFSWRLASFFSSVGNGFISLTTVNKALADTRSCK